VDVESAAQHGRFDPEFTRLAFENAHVQSWSRPGLSLCERSLLARGIPIGLSNKSEMCFHFASAI